MKKEKQAGLRISLGLDAYKKNYRQEEGETAPDINTIRKECKEP